MSDDPLIALAREDVDLQLRIQAALEVKCHMALFMDDGRKREQKQNPAALEARMAVIRQQIEAAVSAQAARAAEAKERLARLVG